MLVVVVLRRLPSNVVMFAGWRSATNRKPVGHHDRLGDAQQLKVAEVPKGALEPTQTMKTPVPRGPVVIVDDLDDVLPAPRNFTQEK